MLLKETDVEHEERGLVRRADFRRAERKPLARQGSSVKSAVRALEVIELFSVYRAPLSVNAVSEILSIPQSSASTLLKSLNKAGFVDRDPQSRLYMPSLRAVFLGNWVHDLLFRQGSLLRALDRLCEVTGCSLRLAVRNGIFAQYAHVIWPHPDRGDEKLRPGALRPLCHDAIGEMLLVDLPEKAVRGIVQHVNAVGHFGRPQVDAKALLGRLDEWRAAGHAESWSLDAPDERMLAVCLPSRHGVPAVIGLATSSQGLAGGRDTILRLLKETVSGFRASEAPIEANETAHLSSASAASLAAEPESARLSQR